MGRVPGWRILRIRFAASREPRLGLLYADDLEIFDYGVC